MGLSGPVPARVPAEVKELVLATVDDAVAGGYSQLGDRPVGRSLMGCTAGAPAAARRPGRPPPWRGSDPGTHRLLGWEVEAILEIAEQWGPVDRSHRKLAEDPTSPGCGSHRRVSACSHCSRPCPAPTGAAAAPGAHAVAARLVWEPNRIWIYDVTHFSVARRAVFAIVDMVSRRWIATLASHRGDLHTGPRRVRHGPYRGGTRRAAHRRAPRPRRDDPDRPILLAVSDNGPAMTSTDTRAYDAHGHRPAPRPAAHPHRPGMDRVVLRAHQTRVAPPQRDHRPRAAELARPRRIQHRRLHEAIGYVTPDDEHHHRGEPIREARRQGLRRARQQRLDHNRRTTTTTPDNTPKLG